MGLFARCGPCKRAVFDNLFLSELRCCARSLFASERQAQDSAISASPQSSASARELANSEHSTSETIEIVTAFIFSSPIPDLGSGPYTPNRKGSLKPDSKRGACSFEQSDLHPGPGGEMHGSRSFIGGRSMKHSRISLQFLFFL